MTNESLNLFALVDDADNPVRRLPLSRSLQTQLTQFLSLQLASFHSDQRRVFFSGNYNADEGEIFFIEGYKLKDRIPEAIGNPLGCDVLNLRKENHRILALFTGSAARRKIVVGFQSFDPRKIISKGFTIINSGNTFTKLKDPGITLQDKLTALHDGKDLLFYSYHNTRHFLDLSDYYREATDADLKKFSSDRSIFIEDEDVFIKNADSSVRKKIALIQKNKILSKVKAEDIRSSAKSFGLDITLTDKGKILLPSDKKEMVNILRFLDEDYFDTVLTKRKCITNSKEYIDVH